MHIFLTSTVCPRSSDPFYIVTYYIKWGTTTLTDGNIKHECKMQCACKDLEGGRCLRDVAVLSVPQCVLPQDGLVVLHGGICVSTIIISLILV